MHSPDDPVDSFLKHEGWPVFSATESPAGPTCHHSVNSPLTMMGSCQNYPTYRVWPTSPSFPKFSTASMHQESEVDLLQYSAVNLGVHCPVDPPNAHQSAAMDFGEEWSQKCTCGKRYFQPNAYTNHINSCGVYKQKLAVNLDNVKVRYLEKKEKRKKGKDAIMSWYGKDRDFDVDLDATSVHTNAASGPSSSRATVSLTF
ncbi:hypothetical protein DFP72DRAFT_842354 [Ephemerocybe angulata]|uniref:Uncharacterized protein n=1 Tax=Ephemerocybe angulata TaxID=980116 RepID=A0A8H6I9I7_9AGAR|nr:hypothetical protein DFP72DRAFT_842354 [Tulosesus angulatus]